MGVMGGMGDMGDMGDMGNMNAVALGWGDEFLQFVFLLPTFYFLLFLLPIASEGLVEVD